MRGGSERTWLEGGGRACAMIVGAVTALFTSGCIDTANLVFDLGSGAGGATGGSGPGGGGSGGAPGCGRTFTLPAASSLVDDFSKGSNDSEWSHLNTTGCERYEDGQLVVDAQPGFCRFFTSRSFHLTCDAVTVKVPQSASLEFGVQTLLYATPSGGDQLDVLLGPGFLLGTEKKKADFEITDSTYDPVADLWWRLGENDGSISLDTSPDGENWHHKGGGTTPFSLDAVQIELGAGIWKSDVTNGGTARFDCFNVAPGSCK